MRYSSGNAAGSEVIFELMGRGNGRDSVAALVIDIDIVLNNP